MALKFKQVTLSNGVEYQIVALGAIEGFIIGQKITTVVAEPIAKFLESRGTEVRITLADCTRALVENLDKADSLGIIQKLIKTVSVGSNSLDFDSYFSANYGVLIDLLIEICNFNFESAFTAGVFQGQGLQVSQES